MFIDVFCLKLNFSLNEKNCMFLYTPKEKHKEIRTNGEIFSLVSDVDVEESIFCNAELKFLFQPIPL